MMYTRFMTVLALSIFLLSKSEVRGIEGMPDTRMLVLAYAYKLKMAAPDDEQARVGIMDLYKLIHDDGIINPEALKALKEKFFDKFGQDPEYKSEHKYVLSANEEQDLWSKFIQLSQQQEPDREALNKIKKDLDKGLTPKIKALLEQSDSNFDVPFTTGSDIIPLMFAAWQGNHLLVEQLLQRSASPNIQDPSGFTPLHWAVYGGYSAVADILLRYEADYSVRDIKNGFTPLHWAVKLGNQQLVELLLAFSGHSTMYNIQDLQGMTALHWASKLGNYPIAKTLLDYGADKTIKDDEGKTAVERIKQASSFKKLLS